MIALRGAGEPVDFVDRAEGPYNSTARASFASNGNDPADGQYSESLNRHLVPLVLVTGCASGPPEQRSLPGRRPSSTQALAVGGAGHCPSPRRCDPSRVTCRVRTGRRRRPGHPRRGGHRHPFFPGPGVRQRPGAGHRRPGTDPHHRRGGVMPHLATYVGLLHRAEQTLAESLRTVGSGHAAEVDVFHTCGTLAAMSEDHVRRLTAVADRYGEQRAGGDVQEPERLHADELAGPARAGSGCSATCRTSSSWRRSYRRRGRSYYRRRRNSATPS